jgi:3-deoxy-D-manno-octulosonic-acid transferase
MALQGRKNSQLAILQLPDKKDKRRIWMHCSSLGEYEQGKPLFQKLKEKYKDCELILTFFSPSGYEHCKNDPLPDFVFYLPFDLPEPVNTFLDKVQPDLGIFVKYDVWPLVILQAKSRGIPLFLIAAIAVENAMYLKPYSFLLHRAYKAFDHIFTQDHPSQILFEKYGFSSVSTAGDTRIDRVLSLKEQEWELPRLNNWLSKGPVFVFGSTHVGKDDEITLRVIEILRERAENWRFLVFPHHVEDTRLQELKRLLGRETPLFSQDHWDGDTLIVNTIGLLSKTYRWAQCAYIGGAFEGSVHNLLEPGVYGLPMLCGPSPGNFNEVKIFLSLGVLFLTRGKEDLEELMPQILAKKEECKNHLHDFFEIGSGGSEKILEKISLYFPL